MIKLIALKVNTQAGFSLEEKKKPSLNCVHPEWNQGVR